MVLFPVMLAATVVLAENPGAKTPDDTAQLLKVVARAANRLLEAAPQFHAEEKVKTRTMKHPERWQEAERRSELRFKMAADGLHESRRTIAASGARIKPRIEDISQLVLLFTASSLERYQFTPKGTAFVGAIPAVILSYYQREGPEALTIRQGRQVALERIHGQVWVRADRTGVLRVTLDTSRNPKEGLEIRDHAEVDYENDADGAPVPVSAVHREFHNAILVSEAVFSYTRVQEADR